MVALLSSIFLLASTDAFSQSDMHPHKYDKQNVQKLESGRTNQLKKDADPEGRTEENKENFDTNVPRGDGIEYPPPVKSKSPAKNPGN
jgi:hypothetical protein